MAKQSLLEVLNWIKIFDVDNEDERMAMNEVMAMARNLRATGIWNSPEWPPELGEKTVLDFDEDYWYQESEPVMIYCEFCPEENPSNIWIAKYTKDRDGNDGYYLIGADATIKDSQEMVKGWMKLPEKPQPVQEQPEKHGPQNDFKRRLF